VVVAATVGLVATTDVAMAAVGAAVKHLLFNKIL
jgi:hypothetical protein